MAPVDDDDLSRPPTARDTLDALLHDAVAAAPQLAPGTIVANRYEILRLVGAGGMGTVYRARDSTLHRSVALKIHHAAANAARLQREAVAMAQLAHPNVVTVYEVGQLGSHVFVAMEYVEGETLRAWLASTPRTRAEILDVLRFAGEGLAAAHAAGLVHRDVKPDNILVGVDGRVRIGDFGLAQPAGTEPASSGTASATGTKTGAVVGTPAYMAPEQIDGGAVDARTDQFAFCVMAWEALTGGRPFAGGDLRELRAAIDRGRADGAGHLEPRYRRVLLRGLAIAPSARWPAMSDLLSAIGAARRRPRMFAVTAASIAIVAGAGTWWLWPAADPLAACDSATGELERQLPPGTSASLVTAIRASGVKNAAALGGVMALTIERQRARDRLITHDACRARISRRWSDELVRASHECLLDRARLVRELLGAVPPVGGGVLDLALLAQHLPDLGVCGDAKHLATWRPLAGDGVDLDEVVRFRATVERGLAQVELGRTDDARRTLDEVTRRPVAASKRQSGRVELLRGALEMHTGNYADAERRLSEAYFAARAGADDALALRLIAKLLHLTGSLRRDGTAAARWSRDAVADAERAEALHAEDAARVWVAAADVALVAGRSADALGYLDRADKLFSGAAAFLGVRTLSVRTAALASLGRTNEAIAVSDRWVATVRGVPGLEAELANALSDRATILLEGGREADAVAAVREAKQILDGLRETAWHSAIAIEITLGASLLQLGDPAAGGYLEHARAATVAELGEDHPDVALIDANLALLRMDGGDLAGAVSALAHAAAIQERALGSTSPELASTLYNLAVVQRSASDHAAALASTERAAAIYEKSQRGSSRHLFALAHAAMIQNLAGHSLEALRAAERVLAFPATDEPTTHGWAQIEAARALIALRREPQRARAMLVAARTAYVEFPHRITEIDALLAKL